MAAAKPAKKKTGVGSRRRPALKDQRKNDPRAPWEGRPMGRPPLYASADALLADCTDYFAWVKANPLYETKPMKGQDGSIELVQIPKMRAMTIAGLCNHVGMSTVAWLDYRKNPEFASVCAYADDVIRQQKFEGASADLLNAAIIARDLGLADKSEVTGGDGAPLIPESAVSERDLAKFMAFVLSKAAHNTKEGS